MGIQAKHSAWQFANHSLSPTISVLLNRRAGPTNAPGNERNQEQDDEYHKEDPGDLRRDRGDARRAQNGRDDGDDQEEQS